MEAILANTSWHWLTTSTMPIFPVAVILTILVEYLVIIKVTHIRKYAKVAIVIGTSNLASFCLPYLFDVWSYYIGFGFEYNGKSPFEAAFESSPFYIVGIAYLIITVVIEVPITFLMLKKDAQNNKKLLFSSIAGNFFTTVLIAITERLICVGSW